MDEIIFNLLSLLKSRFVSAEIDMIDLFDCIIQCKNFSMKHQHSECKTRCHIVTKSRPQSVKDKQVAKPSNKVDNCDEFSGDTFRHTDSSYAAALVGHSYTKAKMYLKSLEKDTTSNANTKDSSIGNRIILETNIEGSKIEGSKVSTLLFIQPINNAVSPLNSNSVLLKSIASVSGNNIIGKKSSIMSLKPVKHQYFLTNYGDECLQRNCINISGKITRFHFPNETIDNNNYSKQSIDLLKFLYCVQNVEIQLINETLCVIANNLRSSKQDQIAEYETTLVKVLFQGKLSLLINSSFAPSIISESSPGTFKLQTLLSNFLNKDIPSVELIFASNSVYSEELAKGGAVHIKNKSHPNIDPIPKIIKTDNSVRYQGSTLLSNARFIAPDSNVLKESNTIVSFYKEKITKIKLKANDIYVTIHQINICNFSY